MPQINVSDETYAKIKDQLLVDEIIDLSSLNDMVGKCFLFRTVTYHQVGRVKKIIGNFVELEDASWVADSGRFMNAIKDGTLKEVEPVGFMLVNLGAVVDVVRWVHPLPKEQK